MTSFAAVTRLVCFPYAGGSAEAYLGWGARLPDDVRVDPIELPGRRSRFMEPPVTDVHRLVAQVIDESGPFARPFALFGHSMGAMVAFELARALRRLGRPRPDHLFVSARQAPRRTPAAFPMSRLPDALLIREIDRRFGAGAALAGSRELADLMLPTLRADLRLVESYRYRPEPPLECPITAFAGTRDVIPVDDIGAWSQETCGPFRLVCLDGDHFFTTACRAPLLQAIRQQLADEREPAGQETS